MSFHKVPIYTKNPALSGEVKYAVAVGVSARALAWALREASYRVIGVDLFGDEDTCEIASQTHILPSWGTSEAELVIRPEQWLPPDNCSIAPVFLGGGCENWPALVDLLDRTPGLQLLGPNSNHMAALRSTDLWAQAARHSGLMFPQTLGYQTPISPPPNDRLAQDSTTQACPRWLRKSLRSASGWSVSAVSPPVFASAVSPEDAPRSYAVSPSVADAAHWVVQQEIPGRSLGATCIVTWPEQSATYDETSGISTKTGPPRAELLGITEAWQAADWPAPSEFAYRGSWGPIELDTDQRQQLIQAAVYLALQTGTCGWLQMDLIQDFAGKLWLLEVNPRWSAGMEILLRSGVANSAALHAHACGVLISAEAPDHTTLKHHPVTAKAIVYLERDTVLTAQLHQQFKQLPRAYFADIPSDRLIGTLLEKGGPLLTILATAPAIGSPVQQRHDLLSQLRERLVTVRELLA